MIDLWPQQEEPMADQAASDQALTVSSAMPISAVMARFKSHKIVHAGTIVAVSLGEPTVLTLTDAEGNPFSITRPSAMFARYAPQIGDYLVVYEDGYESVSPRGAFENGYLRVLEAADEPSIYEGGDPDARQERAPELTLFRKRYRKLQVHELALHDTIKDTADELAHLIGALNPAVHAKLADGTAQRPIDPMLGRVCDPANVTLALRALEDCVMRAVKALTA